MSSAAQKQKTELKQSKEIVKDLPIKTRKSPASYTNQTTMTLEKRIANTLGYIKGFPWWLLPAGAGSYLQARIKGDELAEENALALLKMMKLGGDQFCALIWLLRGFYSIAEPYKPARYFEVENDSFPRTQARVIDLDGLKLQYGVNDFDAPERKMSTRYRVLYWLMKNGPGMQSHHLPLPPVEEYKELLRDTFGPTFVAYRPFKGNPDDPKVLCHYFTHDYGAPWLTREGDKFVVDLSHWEKAELKCGGKIYDTYGGRLEFDAAMEDVSIQWCGETYRPSHPQWARARYVLVSTALIAVVLEHHTLQVHYLNSALFALKSRTHLTPSHPVLRLLRPFTLRSVMINEHAIHSILTESGILLHGTALTWKSIKQLYKNGAATYRHVPVPQQLQDKGLLEEDGTAAKGVAFAQESLYAYDIIEQFVKSYLAIYYPDENTLQADEELLEFYEQVRAGMPETAQVPMHANLTAMTNLLAVFIWNATFWHDFTSQTGNSLSDYRYGSVLIKREDVFGSFYPNMQEHLVTLLAHQLTTVEGNKVVDNFHKFWLDEKALGAALEFQANLWRYRTELKKRNLSRPFTFNAYDPAVIESSVQT